jgi:hypothetical protein
MYTGMVVIRDGQSISKSKSTGGHGRVGCHCASCCQSDGWRARPDDGCVHVSGVSGSGRLLDLRRLHPPIRHSSQVLWFGGGRESEKRIPDWEREYSSRVPQSEDEREKRMHGGEDRERIESMAKFLVSEVPLGMPFKEAFDPVGIYRSRQLDTYIFICISNGR